MKNNKIISFFTIAALIVLAAGILYIYKLPVQISKSTGKSLAQNSILISQINLADNYKKYAANVVNLFNSEQTRGSNNLLPSIKETKNNLIALNVPKELTDVHLNLIISLNMMEKGLEQDSASKYEDGVDKFHSVLNNNSWLLK